MMIPDAIADRGSDWLAQFLAGYVILQMSGEWVQFTHVEGVPGHAGRSVLGLVGFDESEEPFIRTMDHRLYRLTGWTEETVRGAAIGLRLWSEMKGCDVKMGVCSTGTSWLIED